MRTVMRSLATANPPREVTQERAYQVLNSHFAFDGEEKRLYEKILLEGPIRTRQFGLDYDEQILLQQPDHLIERFGKYARRIAVEAARNALARADLDAGEISCLVVNTCTGYLCPGLSSYVTEDLGLRDCVSVMDIVGMGCGAALPNLQCAARMATPDDGAVLSVAVEICSATIMMGPEPDLVVSNSIFGDGASAVVVARTTNRDDQGMVTLLDFESLIVPKERESLRYRHVDGKLRNTLGKKVPIIAARSAKKVVSRLLARHTMEPSQIAFWAVHPGGSLVLDRIGKSLELSAGALDFSYQVFRDHGNMSSPSVMFVLDNILRQGNPQRGQKGVLLAFGAGFTAFAALVEF